MPIYGYACTNCGHTLDVLQKMADAALVDCPECNEPRLKRQLSAPRFRLKGKGWYETDFKSEKQRNLAGEKEEAKTAEAAGDKPAGDAKPGDKATVDGKADGKRGDKKTAETKPAATKPADKKPEKKAPDDKRRVSR